MTQKKLINLKLLTLFFIPFFMNLKAQQYKYDLAICAIFRNEARFMREWIEFHKLVGVQHFYLYNHLSEDNYLSILQPYIDSGEVELFDWPREANIERLEHQISAYQDALIKAGGIVKWLAYIDLDEFLFPVHVYTLTEFLKNFEEEKIGAVCVNWVMFGTSNVAKIPPNGLMIEYLTKCDPKGNLHIKSIVRPDITTGMNVHFATFKNNFYSVNPDKVRFADFFSPYISIDKIRINHYWTRDEYNFYHIKIPNIKRIKENLLVIKDHVYYVDCATARKMTPEKFCLNIAQHINICEDKIIYKYLTDLKTRMNF